jgi:hypothetical protein
MKTFLTILITCIVTILLGWFFTLRILSSHSFWPRYCETMMVRDLSFSQEDICKFGVSTQSWYVYNKSLILNQLPVDLEFVAINRFRDFEQLTDKRQKTFTIQNIWSLINNSVISGISWNKLSIEARNTIILPSLCKILRDYSN